MPALKKAMIYAPDKPKEKFYVQFNPNSLEYTIHTNRYSQKGVRAVAADSAAEEEQKQRDPTGRTEGATLSARLFYHTYTSETSFTDVRKELNQIRSFVRKGENSNPKIGFAWGTINHVGTLESFQVSYQMFAGDGTPVQAEVSIAIYGDDTDRAAEARNRAKEVEYESDFDAGRRDRQSLPDGVAWLFE